MGNDWGGGADGWVVGEYAEERREGWCAYGLQIAGLDCAPECRSGRYHQSTA